MDSKPIQNLYTGFQKYLLMCNDKPFSQLGYMSAKMRALAESQDRIGWRHFTESYISTHFYNIQRFHLSMSSSYLNGSDWTKQFISKILQLTHSQWIYCNILLHDKKQGYLRHKQSKDLLQEITELSELSPDKVPDGSKFLLEVNFTKLTSSHIETQRLWTLADNMALAAKQLEHKRGTCSKRIQHRLNRNIPSRKKLGIVAIEQQIRNDGMHQAPRITHSKDSQLHQTTLNLPILKQPHPSLTFLSHKSNKYLRKPD